MKLNRNEYNCFIQQLDRTAEKNPLLWLPCILLITLALAGEHIAEYVQIVYSHRNTEKAVKEKTQLESKPFALRAVAMSLIVAFGFMLTGDLGQAVYADEYDYNDTPNTDWQNDINVTGSDPFGNMLADEFNAKSDEQEANTGYNVFSVEMQGNTAVVDYEAVQNSTLVVGIYDESGNQLITTSSIEVTAEANLARLDIDGTKIPQYFYIKAYLINTETMRLLCTVYECPTYTQEMQEFLSETILRTDTVEGGQCGENVYWNLSNDGTLTISGVGKIETVYGSRNGHMSNYHAPWYDLNDRIREVVISEGITEIGESAFYMCSAISIKMPNSLKIIGDHAFCNCEKLTSIMLSLDATSIGEYSFNMCVSIKEITIPNGVTAIEMGAFSDCRTLEKIAIPQSVLYISNYDTFENCPNLTIYCVPGSTAEQYAKDNGIPFKNINEFENPDINSSELSIQYISSGGKADINNIKLYEGLTFSVPLGCKNNQINSADILLRSYNDDSIICIIPKHIADNVHWDGLNLEWQYDNEELKIEFIRSKLFDYFECNKKYYLDISNIKVNDNSIISSEQCKEKYSFQTGFSIQLGKQTFNFNNNDKNNFVATGEKDGYHITKQMYDNEIKPYSIFKERTAKQWLKRDDWGGSCFGMSSTMILSNTSRLDRDVPGTWSKPSDTAQTPYESRDIINYYHIIQDWYAMHCERSDAESILSIYNKALNINNIDDIFEMSYYYDKQKKSGHSVVVVGAGQSDYGDFLYIYNPNNEKRIETLLLNQLSDYYSIHWMYPSGLNKFTPESIEKNSRVWTMVENTSTKIFNGEHTAVIHADTSYEGNLIPEDVRYTIYGESEPEMLIVLPPENYYEISSDIGVIDYEIANGNMFFAAKADSAEKSIVSAEDGVKLVNASGSFELTVSANENMPYDMFDISGVANGNVDCNYVNNEVVVNLDNTSDTVITFYHDLETEDYTVPAEYDKFVIGEQDNKEAVFVDTDGDGTYETDILDRDVHNHVPAAEYSSDETGHWHSCALCNEKVDFEAHTPNSGVITLEPTESTEGIKTYTCTVCGHISTVTIPVITPDHTVHTFGTKWLNDSTYHWHECTVCGEHSDTAYHTENNGIVTVQPTATSTGTRTYSCSVCGCVMRTETISPTDNPNPTYPVNPTPSYPTVIYPTNTDTNANTSTPNVPYIYNDTSKSGWDTIISEIDFAADGSTLRVNMNGKTELPKEVVSRIQNRNINLELNIGSMIWTINGLDVTNPKTVNMRISDRYEKIPDSVMDGLYSELTAKQLRLYHSGNFGFTAKISLNVGKRYNGYYATLYYYNTKNKQLEFVDESLVENRLVTFELTHASYYAVAFNSIQMYDDISSGAGVFDNSVPIETSAMPETNGVTIPAIKLPQIMKYSNKKRRYRILKKRRLDDLVFVF